MKEPMVIEGETVKDIIREFYTVVHTYDNRNWYATGILKTDQTEALNDFSGWTDGIVDFRLVKISLPVVLSKDNQ